MADVTIRGTVEESAINTYTEEQINTGLSLGSGGNTVYEIEECLVEVERDATNFDISLQVASKSQDDIVFIDSEELFAKRQEVDVGATPQPMRMMVTEKMIFRPQIVIGIKSFSATSVRKAHFMLKLKRRKLSPRDFQALVVDEII